MSYPVMHFDIGCRNREQTASFYAELFGWQASDYGPLAKKIDTRCDEGINGHITALGHEPHQYVMIYVEVDDIPKCLEKATQLGGKVVIPETDIPDGGKFAWFCDPDGNTIGLHRK